MDCFICLNCNNGISKDFDSEKMVCKRCGSNNVVKLPGDMTTGEEITLMNISKDKCFIQAMLDLRENAPIEYQLKMSQFKANLTQQNAVQQHVSCKPHCPTCGSFNIKPISSIERAVSVAGLGLFSKKINKTFKCLDCKYTW